jgi:hypothetical protein
MDLVEMLGFGREKIANRVEESSFVSDSIASLDFSFSWGYVLTSYIQME